MPEHGAALVETPSRAIQRINMIAIPNVMAETTHITRNAAGRRPAAAT